MPCVASPALHLLVTPLFPFIGYLLLSFPSPFCIFPLISLYPLDISTMTRTLEGGARCYPIPLRSHSDYSSGELLLFHPFTSNTLFVFSSSFFHSCLLDSHIFICFLQNVVSLHGDLNLLVIWKTLASSSLHHFTIISFKVIFPPSPLSVHLSLPYLPSLILSLSCHIVTSLFFHSHSSTRQPEPPCDSNGILS